jgi:hypothetical protein
MVKMSEMQKWVLEQRIVPTLSVKRNKNFSSAIGRGVNCARLFTRLLLFGWNNINIERNHKQ